MPPCSFSSSTIFSGEFSKIGTSDFSSGSGTSSSVFFGEVFTISMDSLLLFSILTSSGVEMPCALF